MWEHYRRWRKTSNLGLKGAMAAWKNYALFTRAHKIFRKNGRQARKNWVDMQTAAINEAATQKDVRTMFAIARRLCPKNKQTTVQFRTQQGILMSKQQSLKYLKDFYAELFKHEQPLPPEIRQPINLQVQEADVLQRLRLLPAYKAAPPGLAPSNMESMLARDSTMAHEAYQPNYVPQIWKDSSLALIPKVARPALPRQLRPIGLTEVSGRIIAGIVQDRLKPIAEAYMQQLPQYAYLPHRTTEDALRRAQRHCIAIYHECRKGQPSVRDYYNRTTKKPRQVAGLQASLDLSQAFDRLERNQVLSALQDAQTPPELIGVIMNWMEKVNYHISHKGEGDSVGATRGVRQGCRISPILWTIYTGYFLKTLAKSTSTAWVLQCCALYADDIHNTCTARSAVDLDAATWEQ